ALAIAWPGIFPAGASWSARRSEPARGRATSFDAQLLQHGTGDIEAFRRRRNAGVEPHLHQGLADLVLRDAIGDGALHVVAQLRAASQRGEDGDGQHAAHPVIERGFIPGFAETLFGDDLLEAPPER